MHDTGPPTPDEHEGGVLALPAELTIYAVGALYPAWRAWAEAGGHRVDGTKVDQVDAAGLQLLLALGHSLRQRGTPLRLLGTSPALEDGCAALGLADWLGRHLDGAPA